MCGIKPKFVTVEFSTRVVVQSIELLGVCDVNLALILDLDLHAGGNGSTDGGGEFRFVRITMAEIKKHEWFLKNLPANLMDEDKTMNNHQFEEPDQPMQSVDAIMQIISEATIPPAGLYDLDMMDDDLDDFDSDPDELDIDSSGEIIYAI
ncbi:hypothetical protein R6Q57_001127 [Mikania cordata]